MNVYEFASFCGPGALSAVTGAPRNEAARSLIAWTQRAGYAPTLATPPMVLAAAVIMRGYRMERWGVAAGSWRTEAAEVFSTRVWTNIRSCGANHHELEGGVRKLQSLRREVRTKPVQQALDEARELAEKRLKARTPDSYTVRNWLNRRPIGTWVLQVAGHVMVARSGRIIAGDTDDASNYGLENLTDAWRVLPRHF